MKTCTKISKLYIGLQLFKVTCTHWQFFYFFLSCADSTFEPPAEWSTMQDSDNLVVMPVNPASPEYHSVVDIFYRQEGKREIVKVKVA